MLRIKHLALLLGATTAVLVAACTSDGGGLSDGGNDGGDDALDAGDGRPPDGRLLDADETGPDGGEAQSGPMTVLFEEAVIMTERLCDLDGDGTLDNVVADSGSPTDQLFAAALTSAIQSTIDSGSRMLAHFPFVENVTAPGDPDVVMIIFNGVDMDDPENLDDDFSGTEPFWVRENSLDACGEPATSFPIGSIEGGELTAEGGSIEVPVHGGGSIHIRGATVVGSIEPFGAGADLYSCGYGTIDDLGAEPSLGEAGGITLLEMLLVGGASLGIPMISGIAPDLDLDGDGLERFTLDEEGRISSCIDGDSSVIDGRDCWADARIADAFAINLRVRCVGARSAGRVPDWRELVAGDCLEGPPETSLFDPI